MAKYNSKITVLLLVLAIGFLFASVFSFNRYSIDRAFAQSTPIQVVQSGDLAQVQFVNDSLYMLNKGNKNIVIYDFSQDPPVEKETNLIDITGVQVLSNGNIFITEPTAGIKEYDSELNLLNFYSTTLNSTYIKEISDMVADFKSNLFALDYTNGKIYKKALNSQGFEIYNNLADASIVVDGNSKLLASYDGATLFLINASSVWEITADNAQQRLDTSSFATNILDAKIDYKNNLYLLIDETTQHTLYLYEKNNEGNYIEKIHTELNANSFDLNYENGTVYAVNGVNLIIENISFVQSLNTYSHSVDWKDCTMLTTGVEIAQVNKNTTIYKQPIEIISAGALENGSKFIILNKNLVDAPDYTYGLFDMVVNNKRQLVSGYILNQDYTIQSSSIEPPFTNGAIINRAKLYKYPTTTYASDNTQLVCSYLNKGTAVTVTSTAYNYTDGNGLQFYQVQVDGGIGYILRSSVSQVETNTVQNIPAPNAKVSISSNTISLYSDYNATTVIGEVKDGQLVYVDNSTQNNGYVKVKFLNEADNIIEGYIDAQYLTNIGISMYIVLGVGIMLIALLITLIIIYVKLKRSKKTKNNSQKMKE